MKIRGKINLLVGLMSLVACFIGGMALFAMAEYRQMMGNPTAWAHLEKTVMKTPGAKERLAATRDRFRAMAAARAQAATAAG